MKIINAINWRDTADIRNRVADIVLDSNISGEYRVILNGTDINGQQVFGHFLTVDNLDNIAPVTVTINGIPNNISPYTRTTINLGNYCPEASFEFIEGQVKVYISEKNLGIPDEQNQLASGNAFDMGIYLNRDGSSAMLANLDMANFKLINVGAPTLDSDATNKKYADTKQQVLSIGYRLVYYTADSVELMADNAALLGFRLDGNYTKANGPSLPIRPDKVISVAAGQDLGCEATVALENYYHIFAVSNDGDLEADLKAMPIFRAKSVAGNVITLGEAGEGKHLPLATKNYDFPAADNLVDCDILFRTENGRFTRRIAKVTANTNNTITVDTIGLINSGDTFLVSPPNFDNYGGIRTFYFDTAEVRNFYDDGEVILTKGIDILAPNLNGSVPVPVEVDCTGYISPLATSVIVENTFLLNNGATPVPIGNYADYFAGDTGGHTFGNFYHDKLVASVTPTIVTPQYKCNFLYPQKFAYSNGGSLTVYKTNGRLAPVGWIEK